MGRASVAKPFRAKAYGSARAALRAARRRRDEVATTLPAQTKREYSQRLRPDNTTGCPGVYLRRSVRRQGEREFEYVYWEARSPDGASPRRSRTFSVDRYGYDVAFAMAVKARAQFVAEVEGYVGVRSVPKRFRPAAAGR